MKSNDPFLSDFGNNSYSPTGYQFQFFSDFLDFQVQSRTVFSWESPITWSGLDIRVYTVYIMKCCQKNRKLWGVLMAPLSTKSNWKLRKTFIMSKIIENFHFFINIRGNIMKHSLYSIDYTTFTHVYCWCKSILKFSKTKNIIQQTLIL